MWLLLSYNNSFNVEMSLLLLLLLVLPLSNRVSSEQSGLEENDLGGMMNKIEKLNGIEDKFEERLPSGLPTSEMPTGRQS